MKDLQTSKTIERLIFSCQNCQKIILDNEVKNISATDLVSVEFSKPLNPENTILFYSSNSNFYFSGLIENLFPSELTTDLSEEIKIIISNDFPSAIWLIENQIFINPSYSINLILEEFEKTFILIFNRNSKNGFKKSIFIESTLFGRGSQLAKHNTILFSNNKLKADFLSDQVLLDTEYLKVKERLLYFQRDSDSYHAIEETENEIRINEVCTYCNSKQTVNVIIREFNNENVSADKIITFIDADEKLPFFSRAKPDQLQLIQFLFSGDESGAISHYNNFLKRLALKNQNLEWFIVNSDLLSNKPDPLLFVNDLDSFSKVMMEVLRGTIMWRKDKFLDFHSVSKLSGSKIKIQDPLHILGEAAYKNKILEWIGELEGKNPEKFGFGLKTIFR